ncbi:winged helix-turn-helix transcriptional regulator [Paenibacillus sp. PR3]|uniref:Winged helix-turn-helix transcriptional regulator n=1 Tax=Paenibacillus terricola TaxID=2763503 RepID=A0ABR8N529_9BACL|nr:metalloregulator ArsR/SmtB family transcription factor [Paenibacillus terricola]MBD3921944.1 winged helix-turn-helix transcriptional regulator [Paenibacillus terricola]
MEYLDTTQLETTVHQQLRACSPIFLALADPVRQDIIMMLTKHESLNVAQIVERSPMSRSAISHHLKILKQASLLTSTKKATEIYYSLDIEHPVALLKAFLATTEQILTIKTPTGDE